jgi:rhodanese-related sulfurtransferase
MTLSFVLGQAIVQAQAQGAQERPPGLGTGDTTALAVTVDAESLIELYRSIPGLKIIDSRHREDHALGYIERSYNLPLAETSCRSLSRIAASKEHALLFYCNGKGADASIGALQIAASCGYKRLFWLSGGFIEWQDKDYPFVID